MCVFVCMCVYVKQLGVQIIEICLASRERNGGLMSFQDLRRKVLATSGKTRQDVSE